MKCPKCNSENQNGNFCSKCGKKLVEKGKPLYGRCPTCGKTEGMNWIKKQLCADAFWKAKNELNAYTDAKVEERHKKWNFVVYPNWGGYLFGIMLISACFLLFVSKAPYILVYIIAVILAAFLLFLIWFVVEWIITRAKRKTYEKAKDEFLQLHPDYAELIKRGLL